MEISSSRPVSFTQVGNELDGLKNEVEAMSLVLRALVESHPAPADLVKRWRELSREPVEQTRPKGSHQGVPTRRERLYQALQRWSHTVHSAEVSGALSPPGRGLG